MGNLPTCSSRRATVIHSFLTPARQISTTRPPWGRLALYVGLLAYSLFFSWGRTRYPFAEDDMMNMGIYFGRGPWGAIASQFLLWKGFYRPMGAAFYLPLLHWFGLNPAPFQLGIVLLLAFNTYLEYRLARALGASELAAGLAALVVSYDSGLPNLQYNIDMIYDVLCFSFFLGTLLYYVRIRSQARTLRRREIAVFLALYLCALNSKELAFTLPGVLLAYEWFYQPRLSSAWLRGPGIALALAAALDLLAVYGKAAGPGALTGNPLYRPVLSWARFAQFQQLSLKDLFASLVEPRGAGLVGIWALVTYLAWRRRRPALRFAWAFILLTPIPIEFLENRTQGNLYIPLAGWAILAAIVLVDLAEAAAGFLAHEPLFRRLGRSGVLALLIAGALLLWARRMNYLKAQLVKPAAVQQGLVTSDVIRQLRALHPLVKPRSEIAFLNDPFTAWDMVFIAQLWFHDRTTHVYSQRLQHLSAADLARMDYIFDFQNGKLVQLK
jgi:hypothetical protein